MIEKMKSAAMDTATFDEPNMRMPIYFIQTHNLHYGIFDGAWTNRQWNFDFEKPFVRVQKIMLEKGWYLYETTGPYAISKIEIVLSNECPSENVLGQISWRGFNAIPKI